MIDKKVYQTEIYDNLLHDKMSINLKSSLQSQHKFMFNALKQSSAKLKSL